MKKEELKTFFDMNKPSESAKKRMLDNIMKYDYNKKDNLKIYSKKAIPALALTAVIAAGILTYSILPGLLLGNNDVPHEYVSDQATAGGEGAVAPILNQFQIDGRHYILLSDDLRNGYGLPGTVNEGDIGEKLTDITTSPDKSLIGSAVYRYIPAGGKAVVAVKKDSGYQLFRFFVFESYNNNQDEDAAEYLTLFGINNAEDISKIQFIGYSEQSKLQGITDIRGEITDRDEIAKFYTYYSALKNSSDKYFNRLFNFSGTNTGNKGAEIDTISPDTEASESDNAVSTGVRVPGMAAPDQISYEEMGLGENLPMEIAPVKPDYAEDQPLTAEDIAKPVQANTASVSKSATTTDSSRDTMMDTGNGQTMSAEGNTGSVGNALDNPITIRIYNKNGVFYDSIYYRNIGFISRYEVGEEFAAFLGARHDT